MKVMAILGSPRSKSNSSALAYKILDKAKELGAETEAFVLAKLQYKGCKACETCKTKLDHCVIKDDLTEVLDKIRRSDIVIMATPVYFGEVSGQFKSFFDRTYSFLNPDFTSRLESGKRSVFIMAQGHPDLNVYTDVHPRYEGWLKNFGFTYNYLIRMNGPRPPDSLSQRPDLIAEAENLAIKLIKD